MSLLVTILFAWTIVPLAITYLVFRKRGVL
jgi:ABC-type transport system involved in multi-copper enzyme maturation permease subunit